MSEPFLSPKPAAPPGAPPRAPAREDASPPSSTARAWTRSAVSVVRRDLRTRSVAARPGSNTVLDLTVDGKVYPAIVKELQRHPVRRTVSHVDFLQVNLNEEITVSVPVRLEGEAKAVIAERRARRPGGRHDRGPHHAAQHPRRDRHRHHRHDDGHRDPLGDLALPAGVTATADPDMADRHRARHPRRGARDRRRAAEEAAEGEDAAEGEGADGEGPSAGEAELPASPRDAAADRPSVGRWACSIGVPARAPRSIGSSSGWATPARSTPAPATTSARSASAARRSATATAEGGPRQRPGRRSRGSATERVVLAFPLTYMNESGQAVSALVRRYRIEEPGRSSSSTTSSTSSPAIGAAQGRRRAGRAQRPAQHPAHLKTQDFLRVRIGVGKPPRKDRGAGHVLSKIPERERELLDVGSSRRPMPWRRSSPRASTPRCATSWPR